MNYFKLLDKLDKNGRKIKVDKETWITLEKALDKLSSDLHQPTHFFTNDRLIEYSDAVFARGVIIGSILACIGMALEALASYFIEEYSNKRDDSDSTAKEEES